MLIFLVDGIAYTEILQFIYQDLGHNELIRVILRPLCTETVIRYWVLFPKQLYNR